MTTNGATPAQDRRSDLENTYPGIIDEFAGFLANPAALTRGGVATQVARRQTLQGLLDRMAQAEVNRFWRVEIAAREASPD